MHSKLNLREPNKSQLRSEPAFRLKLQLKKLLWKKHKGEQDYKLKPRPSDWQDNNKPEKHEFRPKYRLKYKPDNNNKDKPKQSMNWPPKYKPVNKP